MKLKIFDINGSELRIGDLVKIQDKRNDGLTFYSRVQVLNGQLYPFNKFAYDRIFKIDDIPQGCKHCRATENIPEYWMKKEADVELVAAGILEKWRMDSLMFERNTFYEVCI